MAVVKALTLDWLAANIQRGSATFAGVSSVNVTFAVAFSVVPKVTAVATGTYQTKPIAILNKTTTGMTIVFNAAVTGAVDWIAMSP